MEYRPINFESWDTVNSFTLEEIPWLWCGLEPPASPSPLHLFNTMITTKAPVQLPPKPPAMGERISLEIAQEHKNPNPRLKLSIYEGVHGYSRADLRNWAAEKAFKPPFLFPELRPGKQAGITLDGALAVIAALARTADPRWYPGQHVPHGMAKKITGSAALLGLQLDRNSIGKYLKEAGNKIISAR